MDEIRKDWNENNLPNVHNPEQDARDSLDKEIVTNLVNRAYIKLDKNDHRGASIIYDMIASNYSEMSSHAKQDMYDLCKALYKRIEYGKVNEKKQTSLFINFNRIWPGLTIFILLMIMVLPLLNIIEFGNLISDSTGQVILPVISEKENAQEQETKYKIDEYIKEFKGEVINDKELFAQLEQELEYSEKIRLGDSTIILQGDAKVGKPVDVIKIKKKLFGGYNYYKIQLNPPTKQEKYITNGNRFKQIVIDSNAPIHLYDIVAKTSIPESTINPRLYHIIDGVPIDVTYDLAYGVFLSDSDGNGFVDTIDWTVPQLSEQLFEVGEGSGGGNVIISAKRLSPAGVGASTDFDVQFIIYNKGDITAYNVTLNETKPSWTVVDTGGGTESGGDIIYDLGTLYPDQYKTVNYTVTSNSSGIASLRWYIGYQNSTSAEFTVNESAVFNVTVTSDGAYQFNISPRDFMLDDETFFEIGVKNIGDGTLVSGSNVRITFPDGNWNLTGYGGGIWNSTNRSITYTIGSSISAGSSTEFNFTAIVNKTAGYALTIEGSASNTYLTTTYTDDISPDWSIYATASDISQGCEVIAENSTTESHTFGNPPPTGSIDYWITDINPYVIWDGNLLSGDTYSVTYDNVDVQNDVSTYIELFNITDKGSSTDDYDAWDNNAIAYSDDISDMTHNYLLQFRAVGSDSRSGNRACGVDGNLTVTQLQYRWNYTLISWGEQDVFVRSFGNATVSISVFEAPTSMKSDESKIINLTLENIGDETATAVNLTVIITNEAGDVGEFNISIITLGLFENFTYDSANKKIIWKGLILQPGEEVNVSFNLTSPFMYDDQLFIDVINATIGYYDVKEGEETSNELKNITVNAGNRALLTHAINPDEITANHSVEMTLTLSSSGEDNITSIGEINLSIPLNYVIDESTISDSGTYYSGNRLVVWTNLGTLDIGYTKELTFNITSNKTGTSGLTANAHYNDIIGARERSDSLNIDSFVLTRSASFNPDPVAPASSSTLTVSITNPYSSTISSIVITPNLPSGWSISPTYDTISSIVGYGGDSKQFLVTPSDSSGIFDINVTITYTDPNSIGINTNTTENLEITSRPELIIIREMAPSVGTSESMLVRFYVYNDGNAIAYDTNLTEYLDEDWLTAGSVTPLDGGSAVGDTIVWTMGNITAGNYSLVRYSASQPTNSKYWHNSTARWRNIEDAENSTEEGPNSTVVKAGGAYEFFLENRTNKIGESNTFIFNASNIGTSTLTNTASPIIYIPTGWNLESYGDGRWIPSLRIIYYYENSISSGATTSNTFVANSTTVDYFVFKGYGENDSSTISYNGQLTGSPPISGGSYASTSADDTTYWYLGRQGAGAVNAYAELHYNISYLDISRYTATNITFTFVYCHDGSEGSPAACDGDSAEGSPDGDQNVDIFNATSAQWQDIGNLRTNDGGSTVTDIYSVDGSIQDYISTGGIIKVRMEMDYDNSQSGGGQDSFLVIDYAPMDITYIDVENYAQDLFVLTKAGKVNVTIIEPIDYEVIYQGDVFNTTANITAQGGNAYNIQVQILLSSLLSLPDSDDTHSVGNLLEDEYTNTTWNVSADNIGLADITVKSAAAAGTSTQNQIYVNVTYAINITSVVLSENEFEIGDILHNITIYIKNLARTTHDITTTIDIFNSLGDEQNWGPLDSENVVNESIVNNQIAFAFFDNSSSGYVIPLVSTRNYTVVINSTPDSLDHVISEVQIRVLRIDIEAGLNDSLILPGESINLTINISNDWSSIVNYNVTSINISYGTGSGVDVTNYWGISPTLPLDKDINSQTDDSISFIIASPSDNAAAKAGDYTINTTIVYIDPNGITKTRYLNVNLTIDELTKYWVKVDSNNRLALGTNQLVNVTINNTGNHNLSDVNVSLNIFNSSGILIGWSVSPSIRYVNISYNQSEIINFTIIIPNNAALGEYNLTAYANYTSYSMHNYTLANVTQDINITNISIIYVEFEPGDKIYWINITLKNYGGVDYKINSTVLILDSSSINQTWGPQLDELNTSYVEAGSTEVITWTNDSNGYLISNTASAGTYFIKANATWAEQVSILDNASFKIIQNNYSASVDPTTIGIAQSTTLNVSTWNAFSDSIDFNATNIKIFRGGSGGLDVTSQWTIVPSSKLISGLGFNSTTLTLTSPSDTSQAKPGNYLINISINYTDPNGINKQRYTNTTITIQSVENLDVDVISYNQNPIGLDSEFNVNITNTGNVNITNANISILVDGYDWIIYPSSRLLNISVGNYAIKGFNISIPVNTPLGEYPINVTVNASNDYTYEELFNITENLFTRDVSVNNIEVEPYDYMNINTTIENTYFKNISILNNLSIFNPDNQLVSWIPSDQNVKAINNTNTTFNWNNVFVNTTYYGIHTILMNTTYGTGAWSENTTTFEVVLVNVSSELIPNTIDHSDTTQFNVSVLNNFSSNLRFTVIVEIWDASNNNDTSLWSIVSSPVSFPVPGKSVNATIISVTTPSKPVDGRAGNYIVRALINYTNPNGYEKNRESNSTLSVNPYINISAEMDLPDMPIDVESDVTITISNTGNDDIDNINLSLRIYNSSNIKMNWSVSSSENQSTSLAFNTSKNIVFTVSVPPNAGLANYTANITIDFDGDEREFLYLSDNFTVTKDIVLNINHTPKELEPGDTIEWFKVNVSNQNAVETYDVVLWMDILDSSNVDQNWGPNRSEEKSQSNIAPSGSYILTWDNSSAGYVVNKDAVYGNYKVKATANVTNIDAIRTRIAYTLDIVEVSASGKLVPTQISVNETIQYNLTISNGFSSDVDFNITTKIFDLGSNDDTSLWTIESESHILVNDTNHTIINITSPENVLQLEVGDYKISTNYTYLDPNGIVKSKIFNYTLPISWNQEFRIIQVVSPSRLPLGTDRIINITINNTGNKNLTDANLTLYIYNSTGSQINWTTSPSSRLINLSIAQEIKMNFTISIPNNAVLGEYNITASLTEDAITKTNFTQADVTQDINITNISISYLEFEAGDTINWINITLENYGDINYNVNSTILILNSSSINQTWGPQLDELNTSYVEAGSTEVITWTNEGNGYIISNIVSAGTYFIKANATWAEQVSIIDSADFKIIQNNYSASVDPTTIGIAQSTTLNVSTWNAFSDSIDFNATNIKIFRVGGVDVTSQWTLNPNSKLISGLGFNSTTLTLTSPSDTNQAKPGSYLINISINYTDPNGINKQRYTNTTITIQSVENLNVKVISYSQNPIGLDSEFNVNITNTGNVNITNANISILVNGYDWIISPSSRLLNITVSNFAITGFNVSIPANASLGEYPINITINASNDYTYEELFNVTENIFIRDVQINLTEFEPGTELLINTTIENTHLSMNINVTANISILDPTGSIVSWTPEDNVSILTSNTNTTIRYYASVPLNVDVGNYTILINSTYGEGAYNSSITTFTVSTIIPDASANPPSVDWNETSVINTTLNNTWFSQGFYVNVSLISIINKTGHDAMSVWDIDFLTRNDYVGSRSINYTEIRVNTSGATRGRYNFTIEINYTDPNTGDVIRKLEKFTIGVGLAEVLAYYGMPITTISTEENYYINATIENSGGYDLNGINITLYVENDTSHLWFSPITYQIPELNVSQYNITLSNLVIPGNIGAGIYNATIQVNYTDQDGLPQTRYFRQEFILYKGIDVNILVDDYEYAITKPNQSVEITINVVDSSNISVSGADLDILLWGFDGRSLSYSDSTDSDGNYSFSINLNESEGGYYLYVNVTTSGYENDSNEAVFLADDDKTVLIVSDDDGTGYGSDNNDAEISSALDLITEINVTSTIWQTSVSGSPTYNYMNNYDAVMWSLGDYMLAGVLNESSELDEIIEYMENGGGFFIESGGLAYNLYLGSHGTDSRIFTQVLKTNLPSANPQISSSQGYSLLGESYNTNIVDGYYGEMSKGGSIGKLYKDKVYANNSFNSHNLMEWNAGGYSGIYFDERSDLGSNGSKSIYYSFPIDGLASTELNKTIINSFMWLVKTKLGVFVRPNATTYNIYSEFSDEAEIKVYVKDHDAQDLTGLINGTDINATMMHPNGTFTNLNLAEQDGYYTAYTNFTVAGTYKVWVNVSRIGSLPSFGYAELNVTEITPPHIKLVSPDNNSWNSSSSILFMYNVTDELSEINSCSLIINNTINITNSTVSESVFQNFTVSGFGDGSYEWYINCTDNSPSYNENISEKRILNIDSAVPNVVLQQPSDDTWDLDGIVQMSFIPYEVNVDVCELWGNFSGLYSLNQTNSSPSNAIVNYFNSIILPDGFYKWNVWCNDSVNAYDWGNVNFTIKVDTEPPLINLEAPEDDSEWNTSRDVVFEYNVIDKMTSITNCSLIIDGVVNGSTDFSIIESTTQSFTRKFSYNQTYNWSINCTDSNNLENFSLTYSFTLIDRISPVVTLIAPPHKDNDPDGNVTFRIRATDNFGIANCTLYTNLTGWNAESIDYDVTNNTITNFTINNIAENTTFIWNVLCYDKFGNYDWGEINNSVVIKQPTTIPANMTIPARIKVGNVFPIVQNVVADDPITLQAGALKKVTCNATVYDRNGYQDIISAQAVLFDTSESSSGSSDNNTNHYSNTSCTVIDSDTFTKEFECTFDLWYFANNGTWTCNITAIDGSALSDSNITITTVNPLFAIELTPLINYGDLAAGQVSSADEIVNITNIGNVETDIAIKGYAANEGDGWAMNCSSLGNISLEYERFSTTPDLNFNSMDYNLTSDYINLTDFNLGKQIDKNINSTKSVYWKLHAPAGTKGVCKGTVILSAYG